MCPSSSLTVATAGDSTKELGHKCATRPDAGPQGLPDQSKPATGNLCTHALMDKRKPTPLKRECGIQQATLSLYPVAGKAASASAGEVQWVLHLRLRKHWAWCTCELVFLPILPRLGNDVSKGLFCRSQMNFREVKQPELGHSVVSNKACLTSELRTKHRPYCSLDGQLYKHIIKCCKELKCYTPPPLPITSTRFNKPWCTELHPTQGQFSLYLLTPRR